MKINRKSLCQSFEKCIPVIGKGTTNPFNFFEIIIINGTKYLATANQDIVFFTPLIYDLPECKLSWEFYQLIKNIKDDEIDISIYDKMIKITTGNSVSDMFLCTKRLSIGGIIQEEFPVEWNRLPSNFINCLKMCGPCVADKDLISAIYFNGSVCVSTNRLEIISGKLTESMGKLFVYGKYHKIIMSYKPTHYAILDKEFWNVFTNDSEDLLFTRTFSSKERYPFIVNKEEYTDEELQHKSIYILDNILSVQGDNLRLPDKSAVVELIKNCRVFSKDSDGGEQIAVKIEKGVMQVETYGKIGKYKAKMDYPESNGLEFSFSIHPVLFLDILERCTSCIVGPISILAESNEFKHWLLLKRV